MLDAQVMEARIAPGTNAVPAWPTVHRPIVPPPAVRQHWADRVRSFRSEKFTGGHVVLLGDSLTEGFTPAQYFPGRPVLNRGINSDLIGNGLDPRDNRGILQRLDCPAIDCSATDIFILIGINDLGDGHELAVMELGYREILKHLHTCAPAARIHVESLLPTRGNFARHNANIRNFNERLRRLAGEWGDDYLDLHALMQDDQGELKPAYTREGLHLNAAGYAVWQAAIQQRLGWQ